MASPGHGHGSIGTARDAAPHNLYGDLEALRAALGQGGAIDRLAAMVHPLRPQFAFAEGVTQPPGRTVHAFEIRTNRTWRFGWSFKDGLWTRQDGGKTVTDEVTGKPLTATSVVVERVREEVVYGDPDPERQHPTPAAPRACGRRTV